MGMYHSTSGKHGFGGYHVRCDTEFTKEQAKALLEAEERLRASKQTQARYAERDDFEWLRDVTLDVQRSVIRDVMKLVAPSPQQMDDYLRALHNLRFRPDIASDPELNQITVYQRFDHSHPGIAAVGAPAIDDADLVDAITGKAVQLSTFVEAAARADVPLVVMAGSAS